MGTIMSRGADAPYDCTSSGTPDMRPRCDHAERPGAAPCGRLAVALTERLTAACEQHLTAHSTRWEEN